MFEDDILLDAEYHFPHRQGCAPWCVHTGRPPTTEEQEQRHVG